MTQGTHNRDKFSGRIAFVLAGAASAVGLGNLWRFPYFAAKYGGGAFLITYIILVMTLGFSLMIAETAIGRKTGLSAIGAFKKFGRKYAFIGILVSLVPIVITPYYSVIGGWILKYLTVFSAGNGVSAAADNFFPDFITQAGQPIVWTWIFIFLCAGVVFMGIQKGIEYLNKYLMPALIIISLIISAYSLTLSGALAGLKYYLIPNLDNFGIKTVVAAMGQMFFSLSLAMGIMITYGSYMRKEDDLERSVRHIEFFDTAIAFLAGLMIIPAVFAFSGGEAGALNAGPGLMFITLPKVFASFPFANIAGTLFFILVFFAAFSSAISLYETVVSIVSDHFKWRRKKSVLVTGVLIALLAVPPSLGFGLWDSISIAGMTILDMMDFLSNSMLMPLVAVLTCLFAGWWIGPQVIIAEVSESRPFKNRKLFVFVIKWVAPPCMAVIFISYILSSLRIISF
ncbi:MAG: sodium-dependent transporter [Leptospirales bacterium]|nr:sodium-dependent transporter [Leptospirales bacterium]